MFATIVGSANYENGLTMGWYRQPITVQMLLANRTKEKHFGVKILLETGQSTLQLRSI